MKREADGSVLQEFKDNVQARDCEIECVLEPGSYIVVPRTTGCAIGRPLNTESEIIKLLDENGIMTPIFKSTVSDIFKKFDLVISNTIDFKEFKGFYDIIGKKITELEFNQQILGIYNSNEEGITLFGFQQWFE